MRQKNDVPALPAAKLSRMISLRQKTLDALLPFAGAMPTTRESREISSAVCSKVLKTDEHLVRAAVSETVKVHTLGRELDARLIKRLAAIVGGNEERLRSGLPVAEWHGQRYPEWAALSVISAEQRTTSKGKPGGDLVFAVLTGEAAGLYFSQFFPHSYFPSFLWKLGARSRRDWRRPTPWDFVRMFLFGYLLAAPDLRVERVDTTSGMKTRNRDTYRGRHEGRECPKSFKFPCHTCPVGYRTCRNGTHAEDYEAGECVICGEGWFSPAAKSKGYAVCTLCYRKGKKGRVTRADATSRTRHDEDKREDVSESHTGSGVHDAEVPR